MNKLILLLALAAVSTMTTCGNDDTDPDPGTELPRLSISSVTSFEGDDATNFNFKVSASAVAEKDIQVNYSTEEVTAGIGTDFVEKSGTVTIATGEREAFIEINIVTDTIKEADEEFKVVLSNPVNATLSTAEGLGTIRNDDTYIFVSEEGYETPDNYTGYDLVWRDEFNGSGALNSSDWTHEIGNSGWGNNESQYYTEGTHNAFQSGGRLVIEAREENFSGAPYTSARVITKDKRTFTHGRVDIRAILPEGQGIWPALWMLGNNISTIGWPACGEVDIMELVGHEPSTVHGTAHWGVQGQGSSTFKGNPYNLISDEKFSEKFHVFSIIWEPGEITWYVDDNQYFRLTNADVNGAYPFDMEFFFIFNIAVGGNWPGYPDATTQFPQRMYVDYIRVFQ